MSTWTPSIVPRDDDQTVYLVIDHVGGRLGQVWRETDAETTDLETVITDLLACQYCNPVKVVAFNTAEGWSKDVSEDIALELRQQLTELPECLQEFVERHERKSQDRAQPRPV